MTLGVTKHLAWAAVPRSVRSEVIDEVKRMRRYAQQEAAWFGDKGRWSIEEQESALNAHRFWSERARWYKDALDALRVPRSQQVAARRLRR